MNKEERISQHISFKEATKSSTAIRLGIDNTPSLDQIRSMQHLAINVFEPLRKYFNRPIGVSSFFRSVELNRRLKGSPRSQHCCLYGGASAMDIDADIYGGVTNSAIFYYILNHCCFDQLIWEFGDDDEPDWVHVSLKQNGNRQNVLKAYKHNGHVVYQKL